LVEVSSGKKAEVSYDWWTRVDRMACRVTGHSWIGHDCYWLDDSEPLRTCVRCGTTSTASSRGRHRVTAAA
jgi:hypothetical protein